ncbi:hypothetical protein OsJ_28312 [Oryza sativa Japonica Group]|jgi:hypothetical protein|uniref:Uncharacterized protein n=3 Tax=Oryza sativa subsp. japonica TaxID=39947 RepID=A3BVU8_ORYSJ|nr:hypothetical protein OsJ_28312 [Oryza sativa Japonica Group]KAF2921005.1 hypothetical protein DAI22_08g253500 [Oryza sativa Japonica Group]BAC56001.1 hypothetical protein [Oryza sativa Japonica Group]BAD10322.1 hypothetical protein [Oryza sativa Japonica Group]
MPTPAGGLCCGVPSLPTYNYKSLLKWRRQSEEEEIGDRKSNHPIQDSKSGWINRVIEMSSPGGVNEWEDSPGEMESEAASAVGMGMMEVDADDRHPPSSSLPIDADFFNSFPDDFDDQDLA